MRFLDKRNGRALRLAIVDTESGEKVDGKHLSPVAGEGADDRVLWRLSHLQAD
ncbi:hypothetical protein [Tistrella mobilis]|uniref:hypothetical protein n=1 Tax=Tistrella mobilis TaxID=171437 RepID=UPI00355655B8